MCTILLTENKTDIFARDGFIYNLSLAVGCEVFLTLLNEAFDYFSFIL